MLPTSSRESTFQAQQIKNYVHTRLHDITKNNFFPKANEYEAWRGAHATLMSAAINSITTNTVTPNEILLQVTNQDDTNVHLQVGNKVVPVPKSLVPPSCIKADQIKLQVTTTCNETVVILLNNDGHKHLELSRANVSPDSTDLTYITNMKLKEMGMYSGPLYAGRPHSIEDISTGLYSNGILISVDKSVQYTGQFMDGKPHGTGAIIHIIHDDVVCEYKALFKYGRLDGECTFCIGNNVYSKVYFKNGRLDNITPHHFCTHCDENGVEQEMSMADFEINVFSKIRTYETRHKASFGINAASPKSRAN